MSPSESIAMWRLYVPSSDGVAIRSTVGRVVDALNEMEHTFYVGAVKYLAPNDAHIVDDLAQLMYLKRDAFEYERELRFSQIALTIEGDEPGTSLCLDPLKIVPGQEIPLRISDIVDAVRISPDCPGWIADVIRSTTERFAPDIECERSSVDDDPAWNIKKKPTFVVNLRN